MGTAPAQCLKCTTNFALHTTTNYSGSVANASGCVCQGIDTTIEGNVGYYTNPTPTLNVNKAVTSMLVLSAVAKLKRGLKRSSSNINTVVQNQMQEEAEGQAEEATGDNAGEFDANNEPLLKFGSR